jgi:phage head maturation protease
MPWHVAADHSGCGKGKFAVVKDADGTVVACHATREEANKHMAALYANTGDTRRAEDAKKPYGDVQYADPGYQADKKKRYPLDSEAHCRAAWSYIHQAQNRKLYTAEQLKAIEGRIRAAGKKYGIEFADDPSASRTETPDTSYANTDDTHRGGTEFIRAVKLDDIRIRTGGTGRTVEAYAAVFDEPAEIVDQDGHYYEVNHRDAFTRSIERHQGVFPVVYNHGMTLAGTPSERGSVPIGVSKEVRVDKHGVFTVSEYGTGELADEVLEQIRMGSIKAQSYGGRFLTSNPERPPARGYRRGADGKLTTVRRLIVAMREFGPTPFAAFATAAITGVRAQQMLGALLAAPAERRAALLDQLATPLNEADPAEPDIDTPDDGDLVEQPQTDDPPVRHSRSIPLSTRIRAARIARGWE